MTETTHTDIKLKTNNHQFYCSARAIIKQNDQYLVMMVTKQDGSTTSFHYPGGHVEIGETTKQAVIREIREEIGCELKDVKLLALVENFWEHQGTLGHGLELFYLATPLTPLNPKDYTTIENDKGGEKQLAFKWLTAEELKNFDVRPAIIKDIIVAGDTDKIHHLVQRP